MSEQRCIPTFASFGESVEPESILTKTFVASSSVLASLIGKAIVHSAHAFVDICRWKLRAQVVLLSDAKQEYIDVCEGQEIIPVSK